MQHGQFKPVATELGTHMSFPTRSVILDWSRSP